MDASTPSNEQLVFLIKHVRMNDFSMVLLPLLPSTVDSFITQAWKCSFTRTYQNVRVTFKMLNTPSRNNTLPEFKFLQCLSHNTVNAKPFNVVKISDYDRTKWNASALPLLSGGECSCRCLFLSVSLLRFERWTNRWKFRSIDITLHPVHLTSPS